MHIPYTAEFINRNQRIELALKAYATVFAFAYKTALRLQKFGPEPVSDGIRSRVLAFGTFYDNK